MLNLSNPWMKLFIESDRKKYRVRGIFKTWAGANAFCANATDVPDIGVICEDETSGLVFVADLKPTP